MISLKTLAAAALLTLGLATAASAAPGFATANVNLRAGPGTDYPVVTTLAAGTGLEIHGCLQGYSWCDVTWRGNRGWISSGYIQAFSSGRRVRVVEAPPPIISFSFGNYWGSHYRNRSWYRDRSRWERPVTRPAIRQDLRQDRREFRQEQRQDQRQFRQERRQDQREFRQERRQDRREERRN